MDAQVAGQRIGDRERDAAVTELQEHHVAGRLDREEFDARMATALAARTQGDLEPLFVDLPRASAPAASTPAPAPVAPAPASAWHRYAGPALASAVWPLTILICILTGNWYLLALPFIVSMALGGKHRRSWMVGGCGAQRRAQLQR